jgi:hypothetical protein
MVKRLVLDRASVGSELTQCGVREALAGATGFPLESAFTVPFVLGLSKDGSQTNGSSTSSPRTAEGFKHRLLGHLAASGKGAPLNIRDVRLDGGMNGPARRVASQCIRSAPGKSDFAAGTSVKRLWS